MDSYRHSVLLSAPDRLHSPTLHYILNPYESSHFDPYLKPMAEITDLIQQPPWPRELAALAAGQPPPLWPSPLSESSRSKGELDLSCPLKNTYCMAGLFCLQRHLQAHDQQSHNIQNPKVPFLPQFAHAVALCSINDGYLKSPPNPQSSSCLRQLRTCI